MSERRSQIDDFTRLTEEDFTRLTAETERLAKHVEDLRHRIAATTAKRRASSGTLPAQSAAAFAPPHGPPSERTPSATPERPYDAAAERPYDAAEERAHDAASERPLRGATERPPPRHSPFPERTSCLANVSRWLPPLRTARDAMESGVHERVAEAGRYSIITPRNKPSDLPTRRRSPKSDVA